MQVQLGQDTFPFVSVVVLNYNKQYDLERNLRNLLEINYPKFEVIVVDNCSTDNSREMVKKEFPEFNLIEAHFNGGVSVGRNLGFRAAQGEFIVYLDDDSVAPMDFVDKTVELFLSYENVGCLAYCVRQMPQNFICNDHSKEWVINYHGAGHAFRSDALREIGFLDEKFFFGGEEIDSALRLLEKGYKTRFTPEVIVDHYARKRSGSEYSQRASSWMASWGWFYIKHFPLPTALLYATRVWMDTSLQALKRGSISTPIIGILKFIIGLPKIWRVRSVASEETISFYLDPNSEPSHYNSSVTKKILTVLRKKNSASV